MPSQQGFGQTAATRDLSDDNPRVSLKKRFILSGFGFLERVYNLLGSTATLATTPEGVALLIALRSAIARLEKFIGL